MLSEVEASKTILHACTASAHTRQALRDMGVKVAINDFGAGYTSLAVLKHLLIDALKIDESSGAGNWIAFVALPCAGSGRKAPIAPNTGLVSVFIAG